MKWMNPRRHADHVEPERGGGSVRTEVAETMHRMAVGETGHGIWGQYDAWPPGVYRVEYDLALSGHADPDSVCAILDIAHNYGVVLAERTVRASELSNEVRTFSILAEFPDLWGGIEYRIASTGVAELYMGRSPRLTRVSGMLDIRPQGHLATMDPAVLAADTRRILRCLEPEQLCDHALVRLGSEADGGYVSIDHWDGIDTAFSFGIKDDISWDGDVADRGLRVYQFDHTVSDPAPGDDRMVFEPKMIAAEPGPDRQDLSGLIVAHDKGASRPNIILKTDIEAWEWEMFAATPPAELARIAWIVCELHHFQGLGSPEHRALIDNGLGRLSRQFALVHVHGNVLGGLSSLGNVIFPNVIEAAFVNRDFYRTTPSRTVYPTELDRSCYPQLPDLFLGAFRF